MEGKRRLIVIVFTNIIWKNRQLLYKFKHPFDIIDKINEAKKNLKVKKRFLEKIKIWRTKLNDFITFFQISSSRGDETINAVKEYLDMVA